MTTLDIVDHFSQSVFIVDEISLFLFTFNTKKKPFNVNCAVKIHSFWWCLGFSAQ